MLASIALRNLWRHKRRTLITTVGISLGLMLLIFSSGIGDGMHLKMINTGVSQMAGHVVIQAEGYQANPETERAIPDGDAVAAELQGLLPEATITQRIFFGGLVSSPMNSAGVGAVAGIPELEKTVNTFHSKVVEGSYLDDDPLGILLGQTLAETLEVGLGDKVVLMSQADGDIASQLFRVKGIFRTGMDEMDGFFVAVRLDAAQKMLGLDSGVSQVAAHIGDVRRSEEVTAEVAAAMTGEGLEILPWMKAMPELYEFVVIDDAGLYIMILFIAIIVGASVMNTVLMSVLERVREFGVMLSLGLTPSQLARMVLWEGFFLGLVSVFLGTGLGLLANWPMTVWGLDYGAMIGGETFEAAGVAVDSLIMSQLNPVKVALFAVLTLILTAVCSLYPALKAARLQPVTAMHHH